MVKNIFFVECKSLTNKRKKISTQARSTMAMALLFFMLLPVLVAAEYTFPVQFELADRIDRSTYTTPWAYFGTNDHEVDRVERTIGCPGTGSNGAPVRVRCNEPGYILGGLYECPSIPFVLHVGETVIGYLHYPARATGYSDFYNPDSCISWAANTHPRLTRNYEMYDMGPRWACPSEFPPIDIDGDGSAYKDGNPEACGISKCPIDSRLAYVPSDSNANAQGYVCIGANPLKQPPICPTAGNPIIVANGNKFQTESDYQRQTPFGLNFIRSYNSSALNIVTDIGIKWRHNYARRVASSGTGTLVYRSNGQVFAFNYNGNGWQGDVDIPDVLVETVDANNNRTGWLYTTSNDTVEQYNAIGQLTLITNRQGQSQNLVYDLSVADGGDDNSATLDTVTDFAGNVLSLGYDTDSFHPERIISMTDPNGHTYQYDYDAIGNLLTVTYPDDTPADDTDNPTRIYYYEHATLTHQLTGITNETGNRYVTWDYDSEGRAISSELAGGAGKSTLTYNTDGSVTTTNPLNKQTTYQFTTLHGVKKLTSVTGHPTTSCAGDYKAYSYDANGYLASKTDWQGNLTTYQHDSNGRELSRTEVVGTPEERTITTEWHAGYRVPIKITEAGQITEFVYDTQGRLLSKTVRSAP